MTTNLMKTLHMPKKPTTAWKTPAMMSAPWSDLIVNTNLWSLDRRHRPTVGGSAAATEERREEAQKRPSET